MSIRLFIGWPGFGKSLAMQDICAEAANNGHIVYTVDRANEWREGATDKDGRDRWRGEPPRILEWPQEFEREELIERLTALREDKGENRGAVVRFAFPWDGFAVGELAREIGDVIVADDEADYTANRGSWEQLHRERKCPCGEVPCPLVGFSLNPYRDFAHRGRHLPSPLDRVQREVHLLGAMRRPENVHTDLSSIAEEVMLFRIAGYSTLERIEKEGWLSEEQIAELQRLEPLNYFLHKKGKSTERGSIAPLADP